MATIEEKFAKLYTTHVYKDGVANADALTNPRGLARAVVYGGDGPGETRPYVTGVDATTSALLYSVSGAPTASALDLKHPSYILQHTVSDDPDLEASLVAASLIEKRQTIIGTNIRKFYPRILPDPATPGATIVTGGRASSVLKVEGAIP